MKKVLIILLFSIAFTKNSEAVALDANLFCSDVGKINGEVDWKSFVTALKKLNSDFIGKKGSGLNDIRKALCLLRNSKAPTNVVGMHHSRSLQGASIENPRLIFSYIHPEGKSKSQLHISFNGHSRQRQGDAIEVMKYDENAPSGEKVAFVDIDFKNGLKISKPNPVKCMKCHAAGSDHLTSSAHFVRPLFNQRFQWPGSFNSIADDGKLGDYERKGERELFATAGNHPRYSIVEDILKKNPFFDVLAEGPETSVNNQNLDDFLEVVDGDRVSHLIYNSENYSQYKYAILGAALNCDKYNDFIPEKLYKNHTSEIYFLNKSSLRKSQQQPSDRISHFLSDQIKRHNQFIKVMDTRVPLRNAKRVAFLRYLFEGRGIGIQNWTTDVVEGLYNSITLFGVNLLKKDIELKNVFLEVLRATFLKSVLKDKNKIESIIKTNTLNHLVHDLWSVLGDVVPPGDIGKVIAEVREENCSDLAQRSKNALLTKGIALISPYSYSYLSNYSGPAFASKTSNYPKYFKTCANCHSDTKGRRVAPYIPFHNQSLFEKQLLATSYGLADMIIYRISDEAIDPIAPLHMPPVVLIPESEKDTIRQYLKRVKAELPQQ